MNYFKYTYTSNIGRSSGKKIEKQNETYSGIVLSFFFFNF